MTIGKVIRKYRKELGLTQEEMATKEATIITTSRLATTNDR